MSADSKYGHIGRIVVICIVGALVIYYGILTPRMTEKFTETPAPTEPTAPNVIETIRAKYKSFSTLEIPISMTDFGRTCVAWGTANNAKYSQFKDNICASVS